MRYCRIHWTGWSDGPVLSCDQEVPQLIDLPLAYQLIYQLAQNGSLVPVVVGVILGPNLQLAMPKLVLIVMNVVFVLVLTGSKIKARTSA